ncbi:putative sulfoacetate transporter SauU [Legionella massiliensis]|uniref:Putative sulfoacetate transporter SauU n=1 Tax=Legionella massiliensis TaxID=1034943 RepID=A0A078L095_9GAMM|nr:MFS transporter [Legionella massiliensis]CDZ77459.1 putative sulfoacetate transporter SauU [Legionella massiliensis]CEE13197.1 putative sulfoacetate transporter SauU [Legionella massiliensis]
MIAAISIPELNARRRTGIWLIGVSFVLFQFFLQLSSGVIIGSIMNEMGLTAFQAGIISSAFYYVYTSMQIPVGMLFDRKSTRSLLAISALVCSFGCVYFAQSHSLNHLFIGRLIIGAGSAFAFVGLSHLLRQHFPLKQFGFLIGLSETLGFLVAMFGLISMGSLLNEISWRTFHNGAALLGLIISFFCWLYIPENSPSSQSTTRQGKQVLSILTNTKAWINGLFAGLSFSVITVFGAMWAVPFIQAKLGCSLQEASWVDAMIFLGTALSCPLFGKLAIFFKRRRPMLLTSCLSTAFLLLALLYLPIHRSDLLGLIMFAIGLCCGAYMLAYSIANELSPPDSLSTCAGFTNTLAMLTAPLIQPLIGYLLDLFSDSKQVYSLSNYQDALVIIPIALFIASGLVFFLPEKQC